MAFNVNKFRNAIKGTHTNSANVTSSSNYFEVQFIGIPNAIKKQNSLFTNAYNNMRFRCSNAQLPSKTSTVTQLQLSGNTLNIPYSATNQPLSLEFIETPDLHIRTFFETWFNVIENAENKYRSRYYDDIVMDKVILVVYSSCGKQVAKYEFNEVFPQSMSMSSLSWDDKNSVLKIPVEMQYYNWTSSNI